MLDKSLLVYIITFQFSLGTRLCKIRQKYEHGRSLSSANFLLKLVRDGERFFNEHIIFSSTKCAEKMIV